jgi:hypothetical protein
VVIDSDYLFSIGEIRKKGTIFKRIWPNIGLRDSFEARQHDRILSNESEY